MDEIYSSLSYLKFSHRWSQYRNIKIMAELFNISKPVMPSLTAALLHDHILVVPQGQIITLEVQHGQRGETRGDT